MRRALLLAVVGTRRGQQGAGSEHDHATAGDEAPSDRNVADCDGRKLARRG
jgi:hypothetical protein